MGFRGLNGLLTAGLLLAGMSLSLPVGSDPVYKYRDASGHTIYTDRPIRDQKVRLLWSSGTPRAGKISFADFKRNRERISPLIDATAKRLKLHPGLLHAVVMVESGYNPRAVSRTGAQGLMQLMPATASHLGVRNSFDPEENLDAGARYLKHLLSEFKFDLKLALAAYNAGENAVKRYGNQIPPYAETERYVQKVMGLYRRHLKAAALN